MLLFRPSAIKRIRWSKSRLETNVVWTLVHTYPFVWTKVHTTGISDSRQNATAKPIMAIVWGASGVTPKL
jgi:hypothetical protein